MPTWTDTHLGGAAFTHSAEEHPSRLVHHFPSSQQLPEHQALVAVIETGSFSEAARSLGVTKSCISKQIGRLEERLGVRLLQRTTRSIHPTEAGEGFYQRCLRILAELNAAEEMAAQLHNSPIGTLRISAPVMFGHRFLDPIVYAFLKLHPRLGADLVYTNTDVDIVGGGFDLNIHVGDLPDSTLVARRLMTTRSYICASPELLREHNGPPEHPAQLRSFPCLDSNPHDLGTEWRLASPDGELAVKIEARVHCNHLKALLLACQQGLGLALLPDYIVQEHLQQGSLVSVLPDWTRAETPVWLVYPHADLSAKARLFIDFLVQHLR